MRPPSSKSSERSVIEKCTLETEKLFQAFLDVDKYKGYKETQEVGYFLRDADTPLRSGSFGSSNPPGLVTRGGEDASKYNEKIEEKRRSLGSSGQFSSSYPSLPTLAAAPMSTIETDSARAPVLHNLQAQGSPVNENILPLATRPRQRPASGDLTAVRKTLHQRTRTDSTGPSDELIQEAARTIAEVGDKIEKDYKDDLNSLGEKLEKFILDQGSVMTYEVFAATVNDLVGTDRNWTNLLLVMHLGKRVVTSSVSIGTNVRNHFTHFIGMAFGEEVARVGNAEQYVRQHANET